jgi:hypothetical protein
MHFGREEPYARAFHSFKIWSWTLKYVLVLSDVGRGAVSCFLWKPGLGSSVAQECMALLSRVLTHGGEAENAANDHE